MAPIWGQAISGRLAVTASGSAYRIGSDDVIDVVRVLHQRMDADRHLD